MTKRTLGDRYEVDLMDVIGEGSYGVVAAGIDLETKEQVVVKIMRDPSVLKEHEVCSKIFKLRP